MAKLDVKLIKRIVGQKWDSKNYSQRVWQNRKGLADKVMKTITSGIMQGHDFDRMVDGLRKKVDVGYYEARRLMHTETTFALERAKGEAFKDMKITKYRFVAVMDKDTSEICRSLNGQVFEMKDRQIGINCPAMHPFCRSVTVPVVERIMEQNSIKDNGINNDFTINYKVINSKKYHDKIETLSGSKNLKEALYKKSLEILEKQNGKATESIAVLDYKTGKNILTKHGDEDFKIKISLNDIKDKVTVLHNHPNGGRFSYTDIKNYFKYENVESAVVIGHDGSVHEIKDFDRKIDIEKLYEKIYNENKKIYKFKAIAERKTMDEIYKKEVFEYVKKK